VAYQGLDLSSSKLAYLFVIAVFVSAVVTFFCGVALIVCVGVGVCVCTGVAGVGVATGCTGTGVATLLAPNSAPLSTFGVGGVTGVTGVGGVTVAVFIGENPYLFISNQALLLRNDCCPAASIHSQAFLAVAILAAVGVAIYINY